MRRRSIAEDLSEALRDLAAAGLLAFIAFYSIVALVSVFTH